MTTRQRKYLKEWNERPENIGKHANYNRTHRQRRRHARLMAELRRIRKAVRLLDTVVGRVFKAHQTPRYGDVR